MPVPLAAAGGAAPGTAPGAIGAQRAAARELLRKSWSGHASVDSVGYRIARSYMWSLYELLYGGASAEMGKLAEKADMAAATSRWPAVVARLLDEQPAGWLPPQYASWKELQLAAIDRAVGTLTKDGKPLASATWGERNTQEIAHPIASAVPALRRWLSARPTSCRATATCRAWRDASSVSPSAWWSRRARRSRAFSICRAGKAAIRCRHSSWPATPTG